MIIGHLNNSYFRHSEIPYSKYFQKYLQLKINSLSLLVQVFGSSSEFSSKFVRNTSENASLDIKSFVIFTQHLGFLNATQISLWLTAE